MRSALSSRWRKAPASRPDRNCWKRCRIGHMRSLDVSPSQLNQRARAPIPERVCEGKDLTENRRGSPVGSPALKVRRRFAAESRVTPPPLDMPHPLGMDAPRYPARLPALTPIIWNYFSCHGIFFQIARHDVKPGARESLCVDLGSAAKSPAVDRRDTTNALARRVPQRQPWGSITLTFQTTLVLRRSP